MNSNISRPLRIALTKGRLEKDTVALLEKLGYDCTAVHEKGRKLILPVGDDIEVVLAKAADVITYVENGVCDLGVVGKDTIIEMSGKFFELSDLGFGKCRFALAGKKKNMDVDIVKIEGSVELAPLLGLSHAIVDIVETGTTLKENGLEVYEYICPISARLIANMVSLKLRKNEIEKLISAIEANI